MTARLKSELLIKAHIRRCEGAGAFALVVRRGDDDAGAIFMKIYLGERKARLIQGSFDLDGNRIWRDVFGEPVAEMDVDARLEREANIDSDLWVVEIENCDGFGFLEISDDDAFV